MLGLVRKFETPLCEVWSSAAERWGRKIFAAFRSLSLQDLRWWVPFRRGDKTSLPGS